MSGTDHGNQPEWAGPQPVFVLVRPQMGENIGAAARAMWNFGLESMRLVEPRDGWPNPKATAMASGASRVLDRLGVFESTPDALADLDYVFATTARPRDLTKSVFTPEHAMAVARQKIGEGQRVGVLFGPERSGLENADIVRANAIISVPVNPGYASLNLAQCVLLVAYEWMQQITDAPPEAQVLVKTDFANQVEVEKLYDHFVEKLDEAGFFFPETKRTGMQQNLRNMLSRLPLTQADTQIFHGMLRQFARWKTHDK